MVEYTIKELSAIIDRKPAMIYNYLNEDEELKAFCFNHRKKRNKGGYLYDDEVLDKLKIRVGVENGVGIGKIKEQTEENPESTAPIIEGLNKQIEDLKTRLSTLQNEYEKECGENARLKNVNQELINQNGHLLLLLSQEKQEKQALLEAPKKTIISRIKDIIVRK